MKYLFGGLRKRGEYREISGESPISRPFWRTAVDSLRDKFRTTTTTWLLLTWDVGGMEAALMQAGKNDVTLLASASSRQGRFAAALDEVMAQLATATPVRPKQVALAARHVLPAVIELPIQPDKPRRPDQMRELIQADLEPVLAEFGSLWSMGALLQARGYLSPADRERITMEEAVRRQSRGNQLRYGEIAIELELIEREALDECLDQQAALQNLDASVMAGWRGRIEDKHPLWLVCGVGQATYNEWLEALSRRGLHLSATLPLSWLVSDPEPAEQPQPDTRREQPVPCIDLEIHAEEVVAILRRRGRVVATRSEGRIERAPAADWVNRIIADWTAESRAQIAIHFMDAADDEFGEALADALNLTTGHPCAVRLAGDCQQALWSNLLREASAPVSQLPRMVAHELRGSPWKNPDVHRLLALGGVLLVLALTEGVQQYRLYTLEARMADHQRKEKQHSSTAQMEAQVNQKLLELGKGLDATRRQLEPLLNDRSRLNRIISMRVDLPDLLYLLAQAVGSDAVMEEVHNDNTYSEGSAIQVVAWSPSYTGAQDFVNRMAVLAREKGYGLSQMEIKERKGRNNRRGHEVKFWLLLEESDLEGNERSAAATASPATPPLPAGVGISSQAPAQRPNP
jgi:hypothetical protein